jgi:hypothetical protein
MGMEQSVHFGNRGCPAWADVAGLLARHGFRVDIRMIDGELAFPDETPPVEWRELRVGTPGGMVTVRRDGQTVQLVTWGNADTTMQQAWNALTWAFAQCGQGQVAQAQGNISAEDYRQRASMPPELEPKT